MWKYFEAPPVVLRNYFPKSVSTLPTEGMAGAAGVIHAVDGDGERPPAAFEFRDKPRTPRCEHIAWFVCEQLDVVWQEWRPAARDVALERWSLAT